LKIFGEYLGHIISEKFLLLMNKVNLLQDYALANLHVVSTKGKPKVNELYYFIKYIRRHSLVDYDNSEFLKREITNNTKLKVDGSFVDKYINVVLKDTELDLFQLNDLKLGRYLFCSEKFKSLCEKDNLQGIQFLELELIPKYLQSIV